jgi:hypothetical protein
MLKDNLKPEFENQPWNKVKFKILFVFSKMYLVKLRFCQIRLSHMISITCTGPPGDFCHSGVIKKPIRQISVQLLYVSYSDTNADWRKCSSSCLIWQTRIFREQSHIIKALFQNIIILTKIISLLLNLLPYSRNYPSANMH